MNTHDERLPGSGWQLTWCEAPHESPDWSRAIPAEVPGGILIDLLRAGLISDPFRDANFRDAAWAAEKTFHYRRRLSASLFAGLRNGEEVRLRFECLDLYAEVRLNGRLAGEMANMFRRHWVVVTPADLAGREELELTVTILPMLATARKYIAASEVDPRSLLKAFEVHERPFMRKMQMAFGWDNCPHLIAGGIVRPVVVETRARPRLGDLSWAVTRVDEGAHRAWLEVGGETVGAEGARVAVTGSCGAGGFSGWAEVNSDGTWRAEILVESARLWWPNGMGESPLYETRVALKHSGAIVDEAGLTIALRTVEVRRSPTRPAQVDYELPRQPRVAMDGGMLASWTRMPLAQPETVEIEPFNFFVNGQQVFVRGANLQTPDVIPGRISDATYETLVAQACDAHMNMLRLWGGGMIERDVFYTACARRGIMVWQDFYFACAQYPRHEAFLREVREEVDDMVRRLRNHPAIVAWCGDNESDMIDVGAGIDDRTNPINKGIIPDALARLDPQRRYYHPSSPSGGDYPRSEWGGDRRNWGPWYPDGNYEHTRLDRGRILSEGGSYAFPERATLDAGVSAAHQWPADNPVLRLHTGDLDFAVRRFDRINARCWKFFTEPRDVTEAIAVSQFAQALGMRRLAEHCRWRFPESGGALLWKLNDAWPAIDAGLIDFALRPRLALAEVGAAFAPVSLAFIEPIEGPDLRIRLWCYNDHRVPSKVRIEIETYQLGPDGFKWETGETLHRALAAEARVAIADWDPVGSGADQRVWVARIVPGDGAAPIEARYSRVPASLWRWHRRRVPSGVDQARISDSAQCE